MLLDTLKVIAIISFSFACIMIGINQLLDIITSSDDDIMLEDEDDLEDEDIDEDDCDGECETCKYYGTECIDNDEDDVEDLEDEE